MKGHQPVIKRPDLTWSFPAKTGNHQVFGGRVVSNITAGQGKNIPGQDIKQNQQGGYSNRQARKCAGQVGFILPTHSLSVMQSVGIKGKSVCGMLHLDFQL